MGRPRKPTELKAIQGTYRKDRENPEEPIPIGELGPPPDRPDQVEAGVWDQVRCAAYWLKDADRTTLERFCTWSAIWRDASRQVFEDGPVQVTPKGYSAPSGAQQVMMSAEKHVQRLGTLLGLDPVSRSKIKTGVRLDLDNPWAEFKKD